ncbi:MAG: AAA family ATPase [Solirubrobacteraceae bacterium]
MNPFRYSEPVPVEDLINRDGEAQELLRRAIEGNNSRLVAPRRFGKTSLLRRVIHDADLEGWATVYVDFFGVLTLADIAQRIESAYADQLHGRLGSWFAGARRLLRPTLRAGGGPLPVGAEITLDAQAEPPLLDRLALPRRLHERHGTRTLVVFDEFQDVLSAKDQVDAAIRSEIQHHGDAASYVFAGSHVGMMRELFADRRRAFYGQAAPVELPRLGSEDVAAYVASRFERTGRDVGPALDPLLGLCQGHPQRTMLLAHGVWELTPSGDRAARETWTAAYERAMHQVGDELRAVWTALPTSQRRVLTAVAEDTAPLYAADRRHGGSRGGAVSTALAALAGSGEIVADSTVRTGYRLTDPLLSAWIIDGRVGV